MKYMKSHDFSQVIIYKVKTAWKEVTPRNIIQACLSQIWSHSWNDALSRFTLFVSYQKFWDLQWFWMIFFHLSAFIYWSHPCLLSLASILNLVVFLACETQSWLGLVWNPKTYTLAYFAWSSVTEKKKFSNLGNQDGINHLHFAPDGGSLISSSDDDQVTMTTLSRRFIQRRKKELGKCVRQTVF